MAQYQNDQYQQYQQYPAPPPPPPPPRPDRDDYQQFPNPSSYSVNGVPYLEHGYSAPSIPSHSPLPASSRPQDELFFGGSQPPPPVPHRYSASAHTPQSPPEQQSSYNPLDYASQITPSTPQSAVSLTGGRLGVSTHQPYNPADYAQQTSSSQIFTSGPLPSPPTPQGVQRQSSLYSVPRPAVHTGGYSSHYGSVAPPPLPSIPSAGEAPSDDFGTFPGVTRYTSTRYGRPANSQSPPAPSPPSHHRRTSSSGPLEYNYTPINQTPSPGAPPPPPPPHGSYGRSSGGDLQNRPLPRLPSNDRPAQPDYFTYEERHMQANLENQILSSVGATPSPGPLVCI
jgi:hypothetical protein